MNEPGFQQLTPYLWVSQSPIFATNSGIIIDENQACLIDPGITPEEIRGIARFVLEHESDVQAVILTHSHWDHILGPEHFPEAKIITHSGFQASLTHNGDAIVKQISAWEAEAGYVRAQPFTLPRATLAFEGVLHMMLGRYSLRLLPAPGHAVDQLVVYEAEQGTLWAADMLSDREIPFVSHSLCAYENTLARLSNLNVRTLIPGHGTPTADLAEIQARFNEDRDYLHQLHTRLDQAVGENRSLLEAISLCSDIAFHHPEDNAGPHRMNVESAFVELGGITEEPVVGWMRENG